MKTISIPYPLVKITAFALGVATLSALSVTLPSSKAEALSLVSNIGIAEANQLYQLSGSDREGASFSSLGYPVALTNIQLSLFSTSATPESVSIALYNTVDTNNFPTGSPFTTISQIVSLPAFNPTVVTFTPASTIILEANTVYAFAVYTASGSSFQIQSSCVGTSCSGSPGYTGESAPPLRIFNTSNSGASWSSQTSQRVFGINVADPVTEVPWDFSPEQGAVLGVPLFIGLRMLKKKRASSKFEASLEKPIN